MNQEQSLYWYRNAVFYFIDVSLYCDSDGDGIGDFPGLESKVPHLASLGVTAIWLLPFFESQRRDNGYDVSNHYQVDKRFGGMDAFLSFLHCAKEHGIRVLIEMVMAHTGDDHPWFIASRRACRDGRYSHYYVWSDNPTTNPEDLPAFPGEDDTVWTWDDVAGRYYFHRFYRFQPALDAQNPDVVDEMCHLLEYWLALGVDGFRMDALAVMMMPPGRPARDPSELLIRLRRLINSRNPEAILLAEVNLAPHEIPDYVADGLHVNMMQNFFLRGYMLLALVQGNAAPLLSGLDVLPASRDAFQWLSFLSSHDELTLERLRPDDMNRVLDELVPDPKGRSYGRGMRRRFAPMLADRRRYELMYSLLFSLPGAPGIMWGDEIGIGDNLDRPHRLAVRPIMQWNSGPNGGFSTAPASKLIAPPLASGEFGYKNGVNVEDQDGRPGSMLEWFRSLVRAHALAPEIGDGDWRQMDVNNDAVFGIRWHHEDRSLIAVHNLSSEDQDISVMLTDYEGSVFEFYFGIEPTVIEPSDAVGSGHRGGTHFRMPPFGYTWWRKRR